MSEDPAMCVFSTSETHPAFFQAIVQSQFTPGRGTPLSLRARREVLFIR
jgi:hypothetical protein